MVSKRKLKWAKNIAEILRRYGGEEWEIDSMDEEEINQFIDNHKNVPSMKAVKYAEDLMNITGYEVPKAHMLDKNLLKVHIENMKRKKPLSDKQKNLLRKLGRADLIDSPEEARDFLDNYFNKKQL